MFNSLENQFKQMVVSAKMFNFWNKRYQIDIGVDYNYFRVILYDHSFKSYQEYDILFTTADFQGVHEVLAFYDKIVEMYELCLKEGIK